MKWGQKTRGKWFGDLVEQSICYSERKWLMPPIFYVMPTHILINDNKDLQLKYWKSLNCTFICILQTLHYFTRFIVTWENVMVACKYIQINSEDKAFTQTKNVIRYKFFLLAYLYRYSSYLYNNFLKYLSTITNNIYNAKVQINIKY